MSTKNPPGDLPGGLPGEPEDLVPQKGFVPRDIDRETAANMRKLREQRGWTQRDLAKAAGLHFQSVHRYETLQRGIMLQDLARIEEVLGPCQPARLPSAQTGEGEMEPDVRRLVLIYRSLTVQEREQLLGKAVMMLGDREVSEPAQTPKKPK